MRCGSGIESLPVEKDSKEAGSVGDGAGGGARGEKGRKRVRQEAAAAMRSRLCAVNGDSDGGGQFAWCTAKVKRAMKRAWYVSLRNYSAKG